MLKTIVRSSPGEITVFEFPVLNELYPALGAACADRTNIPEMMTKQQRDNDHAKIQAGKHAMSVSVISPVRVSKQ